MENYIEAGKCEKIEGAWSLESNGIEESSSCEWKKVEVERGRDEKEEEDGGN